MCLLQQDQTNRNSAYPPVTVAFQVQISEGQTLACSSSPVPAGESQGSVSTVLFCLNTLGFLQAEGLVCF